METTLRMQRDELVRIEQNTFDAYAEPGSDRWFRNLNAQKALKAFDLAHPEIVGVVAAERKAKAEKVVEAWEQEGNF